MLVEQLKKASQAYYNGSPIMSDHEFDTLVDQLREENPEHPFLQTVGAPATGNTIKHNTPVGSQEKLKDKKEFDKWAAKIPQDIEHPYLLQHKLDGITIVLNYTDGYLTSAVTRGDGYKGEDVTQNIRHMGIPNYLPDNFTGSIRGEALLNKTTFIKHFQPLGYRNPRNTVAGKIRDQKATPEILGHFYITPFDLFDDNKDYNTEVEKLQTLTMYGFTPVTTQVFKTAEEVWLAYQKCEDTRNNLDYEIDGVIVRANSIAVQTDLGIGNDLRPKGQQCIKFQALSKSTYLNSVEISLGHTGAHIPVGKLEPVEIGGVTVSSVLLNNWNEIERLGLAIGDKVEVIRAGDVIPKIVRVLDRSANRTPINPPTECIECASEIVVNGAYHQCQNDDCSGKQYQRLENWVNKRNIKFLGDKLLEELYDNHDIKHPYQLYELTEDYLSKVNRGNGIVGSLATDIISEINKSKTATLPQFLGSLGIQFLGRRQTEIMMKTCALKSLDDFLSVDVETLERNDGFSEDSTKARGIVEGLQKARDEINNLLKYVSIEEVELNDTSKGSICFSGALPSGRKRSEAQADAKNFGLEIKGSVGKGLTYLVLADPTSTSNKANKARKLGVKIISEDEFYSMIR